MFYRTSKLIHPGSGVSLHTPILVPSFSSKAFGFGRSGKPEIMQVLNASREFITRTCLISAYDVYYKYIPLPEDLPINVDLMFLDSGGYEVSNDHDLSAVEKPVHRPAEWDAEKLQAIATRWPEGSPAVFVSYDHSNQRRSVNEQLQDATQFMRAHPGHLHTFLLKPQTQEEQTLESALQALTAQISNLADFHLIGVTEKELGNSPMERMVRVAQLRRILDKAGLAIPIHVFGALDPLSVCLYFVAGAEIFDGLTWSRYAYNSGQCVYIHNNSTLMHGLNINDDEGRVRTIKENMCYLDQLEHVLRNFAETNDWNLLVNNRDFVQGAYAQLQSFFERSQ